MKIIQNVHENEIHFIFINLYQNQISSERSYEWASNAICTYVSTVLIITGTEYIFCATLHARTYAIRLDK